MAPAIAFPFAAILCAIGEDAHAVTVSLVSHPLALIFITVGVRARAFAVSLTVTPLALVNCAVGVQSLAFAVFGVFVERAAILLTEVGEFANALSFSTTPFKVSNVLERRCFQHALAVILIVSPLAVVRRSRGEFALASPVPEIVAPLPYVLVRPNGGKLTATMPIITAPLSVVLHRSVLRRVPSAHSRSRKRRAVKRGPVRVRIHPITLDDIIHPFALVHVPARETLRTPPPAMIILPLTLVHVAVDVLAPPSPARLVVFPFALVLQSRLERHRPSSVSLIVPPVPIVHVPSATHVSPSSVSRLIDALAHVLVAVRVLERALVVIPRLERFRLIHDRARLRVVLGAREHFPSHRAQPLELRAHLLRRPFLPSIIRLRLARPDDSSMIDARDAVRAVRAVRARVLVAQFFDDHFPRPNARARRAVASPCRARAAFARAVVSSVTRAFLARARRVDAVARARRRARVARRAPSTREISCRRFVARRRRARRRARATASIRRVASRVSRASPRPLEVARSSEGSSLARARRGDVGARAGARARSTRVAVGRSVGRARATRRDATRRTRRKFGLDWIGLVWIGFDDVGRGGGRG